jgi:hypothetical protein
MVRDRAHHAVLRGGDGFRADAMPVTLPLLNTCATLVPPLLVAHCRPWSTVSGLVLPSE